MSHIEGGLPKLKKKSNNYIKITKVKKYKKKLKSHIEGRTTQLKKMSIKILFLKINKCNKHTMNMTSCTKI